MRAQSKPFVVEIKTSRRTDRNQPKSIWGNLDLSAAADEVVEEAPQVAAGACSDVKTTR